MAVGVKVVNRPGSLAPADVPAGDRRGAGRHVPALHEELLRQRHRSRKKTDIATIEYPEEKKAYPERFRGLHRLMLRDDGAGPLRRLHDVPDRLPGPLHHHRRRGTPRRHDEKRPKIFEIDELRCVVCGLCVEACPCDAIRMDTGEHAHPTYRRVDAILDKEELMSRGTGSLAVQGGVGAFWREKVAQAPQTPPSGDVVPLGPPGGPIPIADLNRK